MGRHGKAVMPWGKWRGVPVKLLPDSYLGWVVTCDAIKAEKWWWLRESLLKELRARGLRDDRVDATEPYVCDHESCDLTPEECPCRCHQPIEDRPGRAIELE